MTASIARMEESSRWRARDVIYSSGRWSQLKTLIPTFEFADFRVSADLPSNPYMRSVVRKPRTVVEHPIPVGVVSNTYPLVQHAEIAEKCFEGIRKEGIDSTSLRCEIGLTELGEWMNLRIYFPEKYQNKIYAKVGDLMDLRLECFNSVNGSSRLIILFGWKRLQCSNGMVIGETVVELQDVHNEQLSLDPIPNIVSEGLGKAANDLNRFRKWEKTEVYPEAVEPWVNRDVTKKWGKKAACRVFHICRDGHDVDIDDPFAPGEASEKPVRKVAEVPGSVIPVRTLFDVSQALSWVATRRNKSEERVEWQRQIPKLVGGVISYMTPVHRA